MGNSISEIHRYWFGPLDEAGFAQPEYHRLWFGAGADTDAELRQRFGPLVTRALAGDLDHWAADDAGLVALVLLLDQFTRNIFRGTPQAFAGDGQAVALALAAIAAHRHVTLPAIHQVFLYLPLEHSEDLALQDQCVHLFTALASAAGAGRIGDFARYAAAHRDVIARFGRFPHRNAVLGRTSTGEELAYLEKHGGF